MDDNIRSESSGSEPERINTSPNRETHSRWISPTHRKDKFLSKRILKQSSYILSVIPEKCFIQKGAQELAFGIYFIRKDFKGTPDSETVALLGIPMLHVTSFYTAEHLIDLLQHLRACSALMYIDNLQELSCNIGDILRKFQKFFDNCESDTLLLLNIEPQGEGRYHCIYPNPRITLPGGTMEEVDGNDFWQCAIREFKEETHIELNDNYTLISQKKIIKDIRQQKKRQCFKFASLKTVSVFFAIRIRF